MVSGENSRKNGKNTYLVISILLSLLAISITCFDNALGYPGAYNTSSPFGCYDDCYLSYELFGNSWDYCAANPLECYNTYDDCMDGAFPIAGVPTPAEYEWVDNITITNLNRTENFTGGDVIEIHTTFICDYEGDEIAVLYNNGTGWQSLYYEPCQVYGKFDLYINKTLDSFNGNHTVRNIIAFEGLPNMTCGYDADIYYSDTDDLTFFVNADYEINPPYIEPILPINGETFEYIVPKTVDLLVKAFDDLEMEGVTANITWAGYKENISFQRVNETYWESEFKGINQTGRYNITFIAEDASGNVNISTSFFFVNKTSSIEISLPINEMWYPDYTISLEYLIETFEKINWSGYKLNQDDIVTLNRTHFDNNTNSSSISFINDSSNISQGVNLTVNITLGKIALFLKSKEQGESNLTLQLRNDSSGNPGEVILEINKTLLLSNTTENWVYVEIESLFLLKENNIYWIHIKNSSNLIVPINSNNYDKGSLYVDGLENTTSDMLFRIYDEHHHKTSITLNQEINNLTVFADTRTESGLYSPRLDVFIDRFAPTIQDIMYLPTTQKDVDPLKPITFNATIYDEFNISSAILEYKKEGDLSWSQVGMEAAGSLYNTSFIPLSEGNYTIRIFANDTLSNQGYSDNMSIEVLYEKEYYINTSRFNSTKGTLPYTNTSLGNIVIYNTGDLDISFLVNKSQDTIPLVYFNASMSTDFTLSAGEVRDISIIATGIQENTQTPIVIEITPDYEDTQNLDATLASFSSTEFLMVSIIEFDPTVTQGDSRITLAARIENLGNETAENVTTIWTIPSGWSAKNNLTGKLGDVIAYSPKTSFITVSIGETAPTGDKSIMFRAYTSKSNNSDTKTVTVSPKSKSTTVTKTSTKTSTITVEGPASFIEVGKPDIMINISEPIELVRGQEKNYTIKIFNDESRNISNVTLSFESPLLVDYQIFPRVISNLPNKSEKKSLLSLSAPLYLNPGRYDAKIISEFLWKGDIEKSEKEFEIIVLDNDVSNYTDCLRDAQSKIDDMGRQGYNVDILKDLLKQSNNALIMKDYISSLQKCEKILQLVVKKEESETAISNIRERIDRERIRNSYIEESLNLAVKSFEEGNFELASERIDETITLVDLEESKIAHNLKKAYWWVIDSWKFFMVIIILGFISGYFINQRFNINYSLKKLKKLNDDEDSIKELIAKTQEYRYKYHTLSRKIYQRHMEGHMKEIARIEQEKNLLLLRINRLKGLSKKHAMQTQVELLTSFKKNLQKKFYIRKSIDQKSYRMLKDEYDLMISELKQNMEAEKDEK